MIKDGNYIFSDYEGYKDKFVNLLTKFYGEEYRNTIRYRLDSTRYIPYFNFDYICSYYTCLLSRYKNDLIRAFEEISGTTVTSDMARLIWDENHHASGLYTALIEGTKLERNFKFFGDEGRQSMINLRQECYKAFGLEDNQNRLEILQKYGKCYVEARKRVELQHPCDVFSDIRKVSNNEDLMLKNFLSKLGHQFISLSDHDTEIIMRDDFDIIDIEELECGNLLFYVDIYNSGYLDAFTTQAVKTIEDDKVSLDVRMNLLMRRIKYYVMRAGRTDILTKITPEELFGKVEVQDKFDFVIRLMSESDNLSYSMGAEELDREMCDKIESLRQEYASLTEYGCRYNRYLTRKYDGGEYDPRENNYMTYMYHKNNDIYKACNDLFMNEDEVYSPKGLHANFLHELNHVLSHQNGIINIRRDRAIKRMGMKTQVVSVENGNKAKYVLYDDNSVDMEEDINELLKKELVEMWEEMYPGDYMFKESDIVMPYREDMMPVFYDYWQFLVEDFYNYFKENIKLHRIDENYDMYFQHHEYPATVMESFKAYMKDGYTKYSNPVDFSPSGVVDYRKVRRLGNLVYDFKEELVGQLNEHQFPCEKMLEWESEEFKALPPQLQKKVKSYYIKASRLFADMVYELEMLGRTPEDDVLRYKQSRDETTSKKVSKCKNCKMRIGGGTTTPQSQSKKDVSHKIMDFIAGTKEKAGYIRARGSHVLNKISDMLSPTNSNDEGM